MSDGVDSSVAAYLTNKLGYDRTGVTQTDDNTLRIVFDEPQKSIKAGQAVVLYDGDIVADGRIISSLLLKQ